MGNREDSTLPAPPLPYHGSLFIPHVPLVTKQSYEGAMRPICKWKPHNLHQKQPWPTRALHFHRFSCDDILRHGCWPSGSELNQYHTQPASWRQEDTLAVLLYYWCDSHLVQLHYMGGSFPNVITLKPEKNGYHVVASNCKWNILYFDLNFAEICF